MKKIIGVALVLVVVLFALPFLMERLDGEDQVATPPEDLTLANSGYPLRVQGSDGQMSVMELN